MFRVCSCSFVLASFRAHRIVPLSDLLYQHMPWTPVAVFFHFVSKAPSLTTSITGAFVRSCIACRHDHDDDDVVVGWWWWWCCWWWPWLRCWRRLRWWWWWRSRCLGEMMVTNNGHSHWLLRDSWLFQLYHVDTCRYMRLTSNSRLATSGWIFSIPRNTQAVRFQDRLHTRGTSRVRCHSILQGLCVFFSLAILWSFGDFVEKKTINGINKATLSQMFCTCFLMVPMSRRSFQRQSTAEPPWIHGAPWIAAGFLPSGQESHWSVEGHAICKMILLWIIIIKPELRISWGKVKWHLSQLIYSSYQHVWQIFVTSQFHGSPIQKKKCL